MAIENTPRKSYIFVMDDNDITYPINKDYVVNGTLEFTNPYDGLIFYDKSDKRIKSRNADSSITSYVKLDEFETVKSTVDKLESSVGNLDSSIKTLETSGLTLNNLNFTTSETNRNYAVKQENGNLYVNVPWVGGGSGDAIYQKPLSGINASSDIKISEGVGGIGSLYVPVGLTPNTVAAGNHNHDGKYADINTVSTMGSDVSTLLSFMNNFERNYFTKTECNTNFAPIEHTHSNYLTSVNLSDYLTNNNYLTITDASTKFASTNHEHSSICSDANSSSSVVCSQLSQDVGKVTIKGDTVIDGSVDIKGKTKIEKNLECENISTKFITYSSSGKDSIINLNGVNGSIEISSNEYVEIQSTLYVDDGNFNLTNGNFNLTNGSFKINTDFCVITDSGKITAKDSITAKDFYATSDITKKDVVKEISLDSASIANLPIFEFKWKDSDDETIHVGTSAQSVEEILPNVVTEKDDVKRLDYGTFATISVISLAREIEELKKTIKRLEEKLSNYE